MVSAFKTYVLPHLDYCCQVWSPGTQKWIGKIEQVQKRALRLIPSLKGKSYNEKLRCLGMLSLENRRKMFDLLNKYKEESIKKGDNDPEQPTRTTRMTRSMTDKQLEKPKFRLDIRKNSYNIRVISNWNSLPLEIRNST